MRSVKRDWTPTLRGETYCSPACGGKVGYCKKVDYDRAVADSESLARFLGEGWTSDVWENLGWHWRVTDPSRRINVGAVGGGSVGFHAGLGEPGEVGARWTAFGETAQVAIVAVIQEARSELRKYGADFLDFYPGARESLPDWMGALPELRGAA